MFGKKDPIKMIRNGDLAGLKKTLAKNPDFLRKAYPWEESSGSYTANILSAAAFYDQPDIIRFLAAEKGMNINERNKGGWTPLHYACESNASSETLKTLLALGADAELKNNSGQCPDERSTSHMLRDLLQQQKQQPAVEEAKINAEGKWTALSDDEIMFERTLPGGRYRLTKLFNFASATCLSITETLQSGQTTQEEKKFEDLADREILKKACAQLTEIRGIAVEITAVEKPAAQPVQLKHNYDKLRDLGK